MDSPNIYVTKNMELSILYFSGFWVKISWNDVFLPQKVVFILANSADPGEMPTYVAFHQGLHCLPKYKYTNILNERGKRRLDLYKVKTVFSFVFFLFFFRIRMRRNPVVQTGSRLLRL